jgi:hypothetical protein
MARLWWDAESLNEVQFSLHNLIDNISLKLFYNPQKGWKKNWESSENLMYPPITYYWTVPLILDHSYLVGKSTSSKTDTKVPGF